MFPLALAIPLAFLPIVSLAGTLRWMAVSSRTSAGRTAAEVML
jgi:hypothetical protein